MCFLVNSTSASIQISYSSNLVFYKNKKTQQRQTNLFFPCLYKRSITFSNVHSSSFEFKFSNGQSGEILKCSNLFGISLNILTTTLARHFRSSYWFGTCKTRTKCYQDYLRWDDEWTHTVPAKSVKPIFSLKLRYLSCNSRSPTTTASSGMFSSAFLSVGTHSGSSFFARACVWPPKSHQILSYSR